MIETAKGIEPKYRFAGMQLDQDGTVRRGEWLVRLGLPELAVLEYLLAHAGEVVTPQQLKEVLWGAESASAESVAKCIRSLQERFESKDLIQTIPKRGYRISVEVERGKRAEERGWRLAIMPMSPGYSVAEHMGAAIAEETIARLTDLRPANLTVLARDSVFTLARCGRTALQIGVALRADLVLSGTLSAATKHYRLRAEMLRVSDGAQIWVEDLLVEQNRLAGLESELVERLAFRLGKELLDKECSAPRVENGEVTLRAAAESDEEVARRREAYELFLHGHHEWQTLERHRMQDGLRQLRRAIELDPTLLAAKTDLAQLCITQGAYGYMAPTVEAELIRHTAATIDDLHKAESILPALGWISFHVDHNLNEALKAFRLSAHLPHSQWTTRARSSLALSRHRFGEAIEILRAAMRVDPYSAWLHNRLAWAHHLAGEREKSVELIHRTLSMFPDHEVNGFYGAMIFAHNGEAERGTKLAQQLTQSSPYFDPSTSVCAYTLACEGRQEEARAMLERLQWLGRERFVLRSFNPAVYVALGEPENALAELRSAEEARCPWFFQMLADPRLEALRGEAEFARMQRILSRMEEEAEEDARLEA